MSKKYEVKVYDQDGDYITTWKDVVSDIQFNNEINSAGGQLKLTLARNAGDYGEGTDLDFNYKVIVTCFDVEEPNGLIVFQGYISGYTPIYKDDKVEVTVLGYGSELNNYIVEAGDSSYISQTTNDKFSDIGTDNKGAYLYTLYLQTFTVAANVTINSVDLLLSCLTDNQNVTVSIYKYTGSTPAITGDIKIASGTVKVNTQSSTVTKFTMTAPVSVNTSSTYYILVEYYGTLGNVKVASKTSNPYADGILYKATFNPNSWTITSTTEDLYFVIYQYGGNTTASFTSQDPTNILTTLIENYNSRGGELTTPQSIEPVLISQENRTSTLSNGSWGNWFQQTFTPKKDMTVKYLQFYAATSSTSYSYSGYLSSGTPGGTLTVTGGIASTSLSTTNIVYAGSTVSDTNFKTVTVVLDKPYQLTKGTLYIWEWGDTGAGGGITKRLLRTASAGDYINDIQVGPLYYANATINNASFPIITNSTYPALYFKVFENDPSINDGNSLTNSTVDYTFKVQTLYEAANVIKDIAPENWYYYVDQGRKELHFKEMSKEPEHIFSLDKDIIDAKFDKRIEDIVNTVYFTGGDTGGGTSFYKKYVNSDSVSLYGVKSLKYTDTRVTTTATADLIGNNILATRSQPELRVTLEILDSNNNQNKGYDIESLKVGDVVAVRNITQAVGLSTWDIARYDEAKWDYNIYNLSSLNLQIQKIDYKEDSAIIYASTLPIDVNKRIEQINRNLEAIQTLYNPSTPS